jgi:hypothetical protein
MPTAYIDQLPTEGAGLASLSSRRARRTQAGNSRRPEELRSSPPDCFGRWGRPWSPDATWIKDGSRQSAERSLVSQSFARDVPVVPSLMPWQEVSGVVADVYDDGADKRRLPRLTAQLASTH